MTDYYEYSIPELIGILGQRFKDYRLRSEMTQKDVAEQSGITVNTIHRFENGKTTNMSLGTFLLLMKAIGCIDGLDEMMPELPPSAYLVNEGKQVQRIRHKKIMITSSIKVLLWGKELGRLSWDRRRNISYFEYSREFLQGNIDAFPLIASIKMPISRRPIMGEKDNKLFHKLPPFLADSLPDAWGNQVFECWRKENGIRNQDITPLDLLSFIGKRGMGALEYVPETSGIHKSEVLQLQALTDLAGRIFTERENVRILPKDTITMQSLIAVGTSAGGRQPKAIIAINKETGEIRSGQIAGLDGYDYYILKFGDPERSSAELEMAYYDMVITAGIEMMPSRLIEVEGKKHFITMRFDRFMDRKYI